MGLFECPSCNKRIEVPEGFVRAEQPTGKLNPAQVESLVLYIFSLATAETPAELLSVIAYKHAEIAAISTIFNQIADAAMSRAMYIMRPTPIDYKENDQ